MDVHGIGWEGGGQRFGGWVSAGQADRRLAHRRGRIGAWRTEGGGWAHGAREGADAADVTAGVGSAELARHHGVGEAAVFGDQSRARGPRKVGAGDEQGYQAVQAGPQALGADVQRLGFQVGAQLGHDTAQMAVSTGAGVVGGSEGPLVPTGSGGGFGVFQHEGDPVRLRVFKAKGDVARDRMAQLLCRCDAGFGGRVMLQQGEGAGADLVLNLLDRGEMGIKGRLRDADLCRDLAGGDGMDAVPGEQRCGGGEDMFASVGFCKAGLGVVQGGLPSVAGGSGQDGRLSLPLQPITDRNLPVNDRNHQMVQNQAAWAMEPFARLVVGDAAYTKPGPGQILVRNRAVAVNPVDRYKQNMGNLMFGWIKYPSVFGYDLAGEVVAVGPDVIRFKVGDRVLGTATGMDKSRNSAAEGAFQLFTLVLVNMAAVIPDAMRFEAACVLPLGLSTAASGLFGADQLGLSRPSASPTDQGQTLLIWGGSTSVGCNAIQLAKASGYRVVTTASPRNFDLVKGLGAAEVFDHGSSGVIDAIVKALSGRQVAGALAIGEGSASACI